MKNKRNICVRSIIKNGVFTILCPTKLKCLIQRTKTFKIVNLKYARNKNRKILLCEILKKEILSINETKLITYMIVFL